MKYLLIIFSSLLPLVLVAQHQLGWRTDTYAGINSALLNPANPAQTPYGWDLNLGEANFFFTNNYAFLENSSVPSLIKLINNDNIAFHLRDDLPLDLIPSNRNVIYDFSSASSYYLQQHASVLGPSFSVQVAPMTRIGIFSRGQIMGSFKKIDPDLGYDAWANIPDGTAFQFDALRTTLASWSELGFNFSQGFELNNGDFHIGFNARKLYGDRAVYFINKDDFELVKIPPNTVGLEGLNFDIEAGFSNNILDDAPNENPGTGWGFDIGFSYQIDYVDNYYRWEFGAAILDIGQITFNDAQVHQFNSNVISAAISDNYDNLVIDQNFEAPAQQLSQDIFNDPLASLQANEMVIHLPTTLNFQAAYHFTKSIKVQGHILTSIAPAGPSLSRSTTIGIIPRIDRHWWSVALPVSFYAGDQLRLGLSARLGPFFLGTDQLGSFFKQEQFTGSDIYLGVKFFPLGLNRSGKGKARKNKKRGGKEVKCYDF